MGYQIKTVSIYVSGVALIIVGICGLFLPILQGVLCILLGLYILSHRSEKAKNLHKKILDKIKKIRKK